MEFIVSSAKKEHIKEDIMVCPNDMPFKDFMVDLITAY